MQEVKMTLKKIKYCLHNNLLNRLLVFLLAKR